MRRYDEIVVVHHNVAHRAARQIPLQRLPVAAVIEGDEHAFFGSRVEQTTLFGIFAHGMDKCIRRQIAIDARPAFAEVGGLVYVRSDVVEFVALHSGIGGSRIKGRCFDQADAAPLRQSFWGYI